MKKARSQKGICACQSTAAKPRFGFSGWWETSTDDSAFVENGKSARLSNTKPKRQLKKLPETGDWSCVRIRMARSAELR